MLPKKMCFVDTETTGMRSTYDRVIEIGIVRVEDGEVTQTFQTLINPGFTSIPPEIISMTGISPAELENAPTFRQVKDDIREFLEDCVFVAHNVRFDYAFLKNEFRRLEESFSPKHFCTVKLSRKLFPDWPHHNLDSIIQNFNIACPNRHRAFDDAYVLYEFYQNLQKLFPQEKLVEVIDWALKKPSLPIKVDPEIIKNLPESPGVYIFYGESGAPLYVGKSINLKDRVLSHFASDHLINKEMKIAQQIESIDVIQTAGELGALLKESYLVKKLQPLYNRKLRNSYKMTVLREETDEDGYKRVVLEESDAVDPDSIDQVLGVFRSRRQAKQALVQFCKQHNLCEKLLGLEKAKGECFNYRLGHCFGACAKKERPLKYNLRFIEAFAGNRCKPWPFKGAIMVKEVNEDGKEEGFLIDKWCYLGNFTMQPSRLQAKDEDYVFDLDTYKILEKHLKDKRNLEKVHYG